MRWLPYSVRIFSLLLSQLWISLTCTFDICFVHFFSAIWSVKLQSPLLLPQPRIHNSFCQIIRGPQITLQLDCEAHYHNPKRCCGREWQLSSFNEPHSCICQLIIQLRICVCVNLCNLADVTTASSHLHQSLFGDKCLELVYLDKLPSSCWNNCPSEISLLRLIIIIVCFV